MPELQLPALRMPELQLPELRMPDGIDHGWSGTAVACALIALIAGASARSWRVGIAFGTLSGIALTSVWVQLRRGETETASQQAQPAEAPPQQAQPSVIAQQVVSRRGQPAEAPPQQARPSLIAQPVVSQSGQPAEVDPHDELLAALAMETRQDRAFTDGGLSDVGDDGVELGEGDEWQPGAGDEVDVDAVLPS
jgi:hypothetical protein